MSTPTDSEIVSGPNRPRRPNWRLRALVAFGAASLALYGFVQLDRSMVEPFGPAAEGIHDLFHQVPGKAAPLTAAGRRFVADAEALGGHPSVSVNKPGYLGTLGQVEWFNVQFQGPQFGDEELARLAEAHGSRIGGLYLENTGVTDDGLRSLGKFTMLRHLYIRDHPAQLSAGIPNPASKITDAGMVHLKGLEHLWSLNLDNTGVTDVGLESIRGLPELNSLYLSNTNVRGPGLARLRSLPGLNILYLDGTRMTDEGLKALSGASTLQILSLNRVELTEASLSLLKAIPRLEKVELTGCGLLDEEVAAFMKSKPGLKVHRE